MQWNKSSNFKSLAFNYYYCTMYDVHYKFKMLTFFSFSIFYPMCMCSKHSHHSFLWSNQTFIEKKPIHFFIFWSSRVERKLWRIITLRLSLAKNKPIFIRNSLSKVLTLDVFICSKCCVSRIFRMTFDSLWYCICVRMALIQVLDIITPCNINQNTYTSTSSNLTFMTVHVPSFIHTVGRYGKLDKFYDGVSLCWSIKAT